jgi:serine/threonine protein kinase
VTAIEVGQLISGRYLVLDKLGEGGFGTVFRALDQSMGREVAVKVLKLEFADTEKDILRFQREAKLLAQLSHKNIMAVYSVDLLEDSSPIIVMEYLNGSSLQKLFNEAGAGMTYEQIRTIFSQISLGLAYAHKQGIIHRDLSATNVILVEGSEATVKLIDFGLALLVEKESSQRSTSTLTKTGALVGNPACMSPEQCRGEKLDAGSDIYAFGCILYEALRGKKPFDSYNPVALLYQHQNEYPPAPEFAWGNEPRGDFYKNIALKCLQKDKRQRFQSADEINKLLMTDESAFADQSQTFQKMHGWSGSLDKDRSAFIPGIVLAGVLTVLALSVTFAIVLRQQSKKISGLYHHDKKNNAAIRQSGISKPGGSPRHALSIEAKLSEIYADYASIPMPRQGSSEAKKLAALREELVQLIPYIQRVNKPMLYPAYQLKANIEARLQLESEAKDSFLHALACCKTPDGKETADAYGCYLNYVRHTYVDLQGPRAEEVERKDIEFVNRAKKLRTMLVAGEELVPRLDIPSIVNFAELDAVANDPEFMLGDIARIRGKRSIAILHYRKCLQDLKKNRWFRIDTMPILALSQALVEDGKRAEAREMLTQLAIRLQKLPVSADNAEEIGGSIVGVVSRASMLMTRTERERLCQAGINALKLNNKTESPWYKHLQQLESSLITELRAGKH